MCKYFTYFNKFNPHNNPIEGIIITPHFADEETESRVVKEELNNQYASSQCLCRERIAFIKDSKNTEDKG